MTLSVKIGLLKYILVVLTCFIIPGRTCISAVYVVKLENAPDVPLNDDERD